MRLSVTGLRHDPIHWFTRQDWLPAGLTLSDDGVISGTPTQDGAWAVPIEAYDDTNYFVQTIDIKVAHAPAAPSASRFAFASGSKPSHKTKQGKSFKAALRVTGGSPAYRWAVTSAPKGLKAVPRGSTLTIKGKAKKPGTFRIRVRVTDAAGRTISRTLTVKVTKAKKAPPRRR